MSYSLPEVASRHWRFFQNSLNPSQECISLPDNEVLLLPRKNGVSRYPYGENGLNCWVYDTGLIHINNGLENIIPQTLEGQEPFVAFIAGIQRPGHNTKYRLVPLMRVPVIGPGEDGVTRFTVMGRVATYFYAQFDRLSSVIRVFVDNEDNIVFTVQITNNGDKESQLFCSSYIRLLLRHQVHITSEDSWFEETTLSESSNNNLPAVLFTVNEDEDRFSSRINYGLVLPTITLSDGAELLGREVTTSRSNYVGGVGHNLNCPRTLVNGVFDAAAVQVTAFKEPGIAGDINTVILPPDASVRIDYSIQIANSLKNQRAKAQVPLCPKQIDQQVVRKITQPKPETVSARVKNSPGLSIGIDPDKFNSFLLHLVNQVVFCATINGYVQPSPNSLIGIRDIFQALEGSLYDDPNGALAKMLEALSFTLEDGRCLRQYSLPNPGAKAGRADLRQFIDQGPWIIHCLTTYLSHTGDQAFLNTSVGYHEIVSEKDRVIKPSDQHDSVLCHLFRIMDYLDQNRDPGTKLLCALYGDWNDALDGLGIPEDPRKKFGTGVSIMATLQLYQACQEMIEILEYYFLGKYQDKVDLYRKIRQEIEDGLIKYGLDTNSSGQQRILHGWGDKRSYLVGSFKDPDGASRYGLTGNAFWVISGMLEKSPDLREVILEAFARLDSKYGCKTFEPGFPSNTPGVGRICKLPIGTAENGATYIHATMFACWALFKMGEARKAWQQIEKVLPFTEIHNGSLTHSPFVMPNSFSYNPALNLNGDSMNDWQTGSSNVLLKTLIWFFFGYQPELSGIRIQPAAWTPFDSFEFSIYSPRRNGVQIKILYEKNPGVSCRQFIVNDNAPVEGEYSESLRVNTLFLPLSNLRPSMTIRVIDPKG